VLDEENPVRREVIRSGRRGEPKLLEVHDVLGPIQQSLVVDTARSMMRQSNDDAGYQIISDKAGR
jgi:hypothetical protein